MDNPPGLSSAFTANTDPTGTLTEEVFMDILTDIWEKSSPVQEMTILVDAEMCRLKLEPSVRRFKAYRALGIRPGSPKSRKVTARPRRGA